MLKKIAWLTFLMVTFLIGLVFLTTKRVHYGGDIVEYFGITESFINHGSLDLNLIDQLNLEGRLGKGYFENPEYYLQGRNEKRYAVHFPLYSLLNVPTRIVLKTFGIDAYQTFRWTNLFILTITSFIILKYFLKSDFQKIVYLIIVYLSPLIWHLVWPGPEIFSLSLILLSIFFFFEKNIVWAIIISALASFQSQPLIVIPLIYLATYFWQKYQKGGNFDAFLNSITQKEILFSLGAFVLIFLPNFYYLQIFGSYSPYAKLTGVGLQNFTLKKFFELFFDLNIGLFFYAPVIFIVGFYNLYQAVKKDKNNFWFLIMMVFLSVLYLTNTNWNNGTAGFGPTRYALPVLPFLIYFYLKSAKTNFKNYLVLTAIIISQLLILSFNGFLMPDLENTLEHTPMAKFVLNNFPWAYNPTPEIFVERTSHQEGGFWGTTIYKNRDKCKKAYVLKTKTDKVIQECGFIPEKYSNKLKNEFLMRADFSRKVITTEATFYPADEACAWDFEPSQEKPYVCMRNIQDVVAYTGLKDEGRFEKGDSFGVWRLKWGKPTEITVPAGYIIHHYSLDGTYVDY